MDGVLQDVKNLKIKSHIEKNSERGHALDRTMNCFIKCKIVNGNLFYISI